MHNSALSAEGPKNRSGSRNLQRYLGIAGGSAVLLGATYRATPVMVSAFISLFSIAKTSDIAVERNARVLADSALRADLTKRLDVQKRAGDDTRKWTWCILNHVGTNACNAMQPPALGGE